MAKVKKNMFMQGLSGSLGDLVFRQMPDGSTRVSVKPQDDKRNFNQEQKGNQDHFGWAVAYARQAKSEPFYAGLALETGRDAYHVALSDCLKAPVIHAIQHADGQVRVLASDNVMVTNVRVSILDGQGNLLEQGQAHLVDPVGDPERWEYHSQSQGTLEVTACDLAGNETRAVL